MDSGVDFRKSDVGTCVRINADYEREERNESELRASQQKSERKISQVSWNLKISSLLNTMYKGNRSAGAYRDS